MYFNSTTAGLYFLNRHISPEISKQALITYTVAQPSIYLCWGRISLNDHVLLMVHNVLSHFLAGGSTEDVVLIWG